MFNPPRRDFAEVILPLNANTDPAYYSGFEVFAVSSNTNLQHGLKTVTTQVWEVVTNAHYTLPHPGSEPTPANEYAAAQWEAAYDEYLASYVAGHWTVADCISPSVWVDGYYALPYPPPPVSVDIVNDWDAYIGSWQADVYGFVPHSTMQQTSIIWFFSSFRMNPPYLSAVPSIDCNYTDVSGGSEYTINTMGSPLIGSSTLNLSVYPNRRFIPRITSFYAVFYHGEASSGLLDLSGLLNSGDHALPCRTIWRSKYKEDISPGSLSFYDRGDLQ